MKIKKLSPTAANLILMFIAIAVLMIPAFTISYAELSKTTHIIDVQGDYIDGTNISAQTINQTTIETIYNINTILNTSVSFDSGLFAYRESGLVSTRQTIDYVDGYTYIGNNTYTANLNYSAYETDYSHITYFVELDLNNSEIATYDFLRITHSNTDVPVCIWYQIGVVHNVIYPVQITSDEFIIIPGLNEKSSMGQFPDGRVYLVFGDEMNIETETFDFAVEGFNLNAADALTWSDEQIYIMTLLGCDMILIIGFIFTTNFIDVAVDNSKPRKPRKTRKYRKSRK